MRFVNHYLIAAGAMVALTAVFITHGVPEAIGQPVDDAGTSAHDPKPPLPATLSDDSRPTRENSDKNRELMRAAEEAYVESLAAYRTGAVTDPEVVYRWSLRWMKAEQALGENPDAPEAKQHLRRMSELADLVARHPSTKEGEATDKVVLRLAVDYYRAEAESLVAKATAKPDKHVSSHDAAIAIAEEYARAVLQGNTEAAAKLAVPGSIAASKRLMESFKGFASAESFTVRAIQGVGLETLVRKHTTVSIEEAQPAESTANGETRARFTISLVVKDGRWLVTNFAVHKTAASQQSGKAASHGSPLDQSNGNRNPLTTTWPAAANPGPIETKLVFLQHAKASELSTMLTQLAVGAPDVVVAVDARTNRLIVRGPAGNVTEVVELIAELDVPRPQVTTDEAAGPDSALRPGQPRDNYGGAR
ncbi:MAG: secretin N-terminal domain-containing protein [Pirellulales bacterium]